MRWLLIILLMLGATLHAQELPPDLAHKVEVFKLKAELHETKVALVKANAEKLLAQAQLEGLQLRVEQAELEAAALKALQAPDGSTFDWSTLKLRE